jgi:FkbM family methyltransferase
MQHNWRVQEFDDAIPPKVPTLRSIVGLYRAALWLTRCHGFHTLARAHARLFPRGQFVFLPTGARMFVPPDPHFFGFVLGTHERHITEMLRRHTRPGDLCLDVGANIGYFTAIMAQLAAPSGTIIAFEPVPENFSILKLNSELDSLGRESVRPINVAVSDRDGVLRIIRREYSTYHQVTASNDTCAGEVIPCVSIDNELARLPSIQHIGFMKIDVEGHELSVLRGARRSLEAGLVKKLIVEVTPGPDVAEMSEIFRSGRGQVKCWIDGSWRDEDLKMLPSRTDVFVDYAMRCA